MKTHHAAETIAPVPDSHLPLQRAYLHERQRPNDPYLFQPHSGGQVDVYTWKRTMDEARRVASWLTSKDLPKGSRIGMVSKNCAQHFIFDLGIWMAGHVSVAVYPTMAADTLNYIIGHSGISILFVGKLDDWDGMKDGVPAEVEMVTCPLSPTVEGATTWDQILGHEPMSGEPTRDRDDTLMLMYTSGSTGTPKGVESTVAQSSSWVWSANHIMKSTPEDRMISYLPLAHAMERNGLLVGSMVIGFQVYFAESLDTFIEDVKRCKPTVFHSVPRLWLKFKAGVEAKMPPKKLARLLKIPLFGNVVRKKVLSGLGLDSCRMALTGSAPMPPNVLDWYGTLGLELLEGYGMTENNILCSLGRPGNGRSGYVGQALPGVEVRISDAGEIQTKSAGIMKGYYRDPEKTTETFTEDGWLKTGDRGELHQDGSVKITGRVKELFKTQKGKYIAPAPIENMLNTTGLIEQSCVTGLGLPQPFAIAILNEQAREDFLGGGRAAIISQLEKIFAEINAQLPGHEKLSNLVLTTDEWLIPNGLLTPTMKIKRGAIEERYARYSVEGALTKPGVIIDEAAMEVVA